jgi:Xaa-Pro aminopeptidase
MTVDQKLSLLRQKMKENDVDALIVPSSDSHQSEYVAPYWQSREWISGFTGSAGTAVITLDHAGVWTDSRYYLQAEEELSDSEFVLHKVINYSPDFVAFLLDQLQEGDTVACDGKVFSKSEIDAYQKSFWCPKHRGECLSGPGGNDLGGPSPLTTRAHFFHWM